MRIEEAIFEQRRYSEEEVGFFFDETDMVKLKGKAGASFMEDTWNIHRGLPPRRQHRLMFQVQYALQPVQYFKYPQLVNERIEGVRAISLF